MKNLTTIDYLKNAIKKNSVALFDVRYKLGDEEYGKIEYDKGHIPGAIFIPMEGVLTGKVGEHGGRHPLPDMEVFRNKMMELGVDDNIDVVVYDDGELAMAGRLWFMLHLIGKTNVYVLNGGIKEWISLGNELELKVAQPISRGVLSANYNKEIIADVEDVKKAIESVNEAIIDSRTSDRYRGEIEPIDRIPGHIPTSLNYPWPELVGTEKPLTNEDLKKHYAALAKFDKLLVHCGSGITGTVNMMFLEEAGFKPKLYLGGYSDWVSYSNNKIASEV